MVKVLSCGGDGGLFSPVWRASRLVLAIGGPMEGFRTLELAGCYPGLEAVKFADAVYGIRGRCDWCAPEGGRSAKREAENCVERGMRKKERSRGRRTSAFRSRCGCRPEVQGR
jgi:hypothetical protein